MALGGWVAAIESGAFVGRKDQCSACASLLHGFWNIWLVRGGRREDRREYLRPFRTVLA